MCLIKKGTGMDDRELTDIFVKTKSRYEASVKDVVEEIILVEKNLKEYSAGLNYIQDIISYYIEGVRDLNDHYGKHYVREWILNSSIEEILKKSMLLFHKVNEKKAKFNGRKLNIKEECIVSCYDCLMYLCNGLLISMLDYPDKVGNVFKDELFLDSIDVLDKKIFKFITEF